MRPRALAGRLGGVLLALGSTLLGLLLVDVVLRARAHLQSAGC